MYIRISKLTFQHTTSECNLNVRSSWCVSCQACGYDVDLGCCSGVSCNAKDMAGTPMVSWAPTTNQQEHHSDHPVFSDFRFQIQCQRIVWWRADVPESLLLPDAQVHDLNIVRVGMHRWQGRIGYNCMLLVTLNLGQMRCTFQNALLIRPSGIVIQRFWERWTLQISCRAACWWGRTRLRDKTRQQHSTQSNLHYCI